MKRAMFVLFVLSASAAYAITPEQCSFFENDGKTAICQATGSARNPYVILRVSEEACFAHAGHSGDYVSVNDPTCEGQGCLPVGAPCDATLPCCEGSACVSGACQPVAPTCGSEGDACTQDADCCSGLCDPTNICGTP